MAPIVAVAAAGGIIIGKYTGVAIIAWKSPLAFISFKYVAGMTAGKAAAYTAGTMVVTKVVKDAMSDT